LITNLTELFDSKLREARRLGMFCRKRGIAGVRQCRQWRLDRVRHYRWPHRQNWRVG